MERNFWNGHQNHLKIQSNTGWLLNVLQDVYFIKQLYV